MNSSRFAVGSLWFVICAILLAMTSNTSNAAEITITPLNDTPQTNTTYTLNITINNNETIHGLEIKIQETPDNAIYAGYNTTTRLTGAVVSVATTNTTTTIAIIFDAMSAGLTPANETIIQLHYNATTTGQTNYTITELHTYNSTGNETTGHTTTNASVMIISPPTPYVSSIKATNATGNISEQKTIAICLNNENDITQLNMTINWDSRIHYLNYTLQNDAINATITNTTNQTTMQLSIAGNLTPHNCNETNATIIELTYRLLTLGQIPVNIVNITTHNETLNSTSAIIDVHAQNKIKIPTQTATTASTVIPLICIQNDQPIKTITATIKYNAAILDWTAPTTLAGGTLTTTDTTGGKIITLENPTFNQHDACTPIIALPFTTTGTIGTHSPLDLENVTITNTSNDNMTFTTENGRIDISNNYLACAATTAKQGTTTPVFISLTNNDTTTTQHMKLDIGNLTYNTSAAIIGTINVTNDTNITIDQTFSPLNPSTRATTTLTLNVPKGTPSGQYDIDFIDATINNNTAGPQHACTVTVITDYCHDNDADGYGTGVGCLIQDCNDNNPAIHPGKTEACNGQDDNCNGISDEGVCSSSSGGGGGGSGSSSSASASSASSSSASAASGGSNSLSTLENLVNRKTTPTIVKAPPKQEKPTPAPETPALDAPPEPKETNLDSELLEWAFLVFLGVLVIGGTSVYQSLHRTEKKEKIQITPPTIPITQRITNKLDKYKKTPVILPEPPKRTGITPAYFPTQKTTQPTQTKHKIEVLPPKEQLDKLTQPEKLTREEYAERLKQKHK